VINLEKKNKIFIVFIVVVIIVAVLAGYYSLAHYKNYKYYDDYRLQAYNGQKVSDLFTEVSNSSNNKSTNISKWYENYPDFLNKLDEVKTVENTRKYYIREMMYYSTSDQQKKYATMLSNESDLIIAYTNLYEDLLNAEYNNNTSKINTIEFNGTIEAIKANDNQRGDLRAKNPEFAKLLSQQVESITNNTNI
jgi:flagellar basal body-associated protein FliL